MVPALPASRRPAAAHNDGMRIAWYACRGNWRQMWRITLVVAVIGGLLGAVALGSLAAARRTDSAYGRYLGSVHDSDVMVDIPGPIMSILKAVEHAPQAVSSAAWIGVAGDPVIRGKVDPGFQTNALTGSLDDEFYRQDKVTVLAGKLPPPGAANEIMLTQSEADAFWQQYRVRYRVGDLMTWQLYAGEPTSDTPAAKDRAGHLPDRRDREHFSRASRRSTMPSRPHSSRRPPPSGSSASPPVKATSGHSAGLRCGCATVTPTCPRSGPGSTSSASS